MSTAVLEITLHAAGQATAAKKFVGGKPTDTQETNKDGVPRWNLKAQAVQNGNVLPGQVNVKYFSHEKPEFAPFEVIEGATLGLWEGKLTVRVDA